MAEDLRRYMRPSSASAEEPAPRHPRWRRIWQLVVGGGQQRPRSARERLGTFFAVTLAALMATVGALAANGGDLRAGRNQDLSSLVGARARDNKKLAEQMSRQRAELDALQNKSAADPKQAAALEKAAVAAGAHPVKGPAVRVVLDDAPDDVKPDDVDEDLLIVHQQDIQMVVNLLWQAGAEAMTVQGQRVISTTGIKCVGNSVVLHDIPYAPPYVIEAIGDVDALIAALDGDEQVKVYKQYTAAYQLGWKQERAGEVSMLAYAGQTELKYARPPR